MGKSGSGFTVDSALVACAAIALIALEVRHLRPRVSEPISEPEKVEGAIPEHAVAPPQPMPSFVVPSPKASPRKLGKYPALVQSWGFDLTPLKAFFPDNDAGDLLEAYVICFGQSGMPGNCPKYVDRLEMLKEIDRTPGIVEATEFAYDQLRLHRDSDELDEWYDRFCLAIVATSLLGHPESEKMAIPLIEKIALTPFRPAKPDQIPIVPPYWVLTNYSHFASKSDFENLKKRSLAAQPDPNLREAISKLEAWVPLNN